MSPRKIIKHLNLSHLIWIIYSHMYFLLKNVTFLIKYIYCYGSPDISVMRHPNFHFLNRLFQYWYSVKKWLRILQFFQVDQVLMLYELSVVLVSLLKYFKTFAIKSIIIYSKNLILLSKWYVWSEKLWIFCAFDLNEKNVFRYWVAYNNLRH